ncbi:sigma-70 family RNA polymerase sigma factor [Clostridium sp. 'deep sea']|uniref:sigma-70 family RNA polymerase sigma factor n=1 Tax=Clostridium sp. 'deep sea' TaxID=2779445 RepID=UPI0018965EE2|nr:sigma-70 family RNA polymerase sigma factor [Clostridium sp. 'deep sea']QOR33637.1 sigma-70 family RNA polymerase sigma factor [Clostridium sp. 'deep sea']
MQNSLAEKNLINEALAGNLESLAQLLHLNYNKVYGYLVKLTLNKELALDLAQESMTKAIEKLEQYNNCKASFSTWLIQIAINTSRDWYRKEKRKKEFYDNLLNQSLNGLPLSSLNNNTNIGYDREEILDTLMVLKNIPAKIRIPVILKYYYGYEQSEIAKFLKIPKGTVKSRISNGLKRIRKELQR